MRDTGEVVYTFRQTGLSLEEVLKAVLADKLREVVYDAEEGGGDVSAPVARG